MSLVLTCASIFVGVSTVTAWVVWRVHRFLHAAMLRWRCGGLLRVDEAQLRSLPATSRLNRKLLRAGYRSFRGPIVVWLVRSGSLIAAAAFPWLAYRHGVALTSLMTLGAMILAAGWMLPEWWLSMTIARRFSEINRHLPDVLDLLVICLEAGLSLNAALVKVAEDMERTSPVLSDELQYTNREIVMGCPRAEALQHLGARCGNEDFSALLAVVIQSEKFGMGMARTFRLQVDTMRQKRRQRIQEIAHKMPIKMVFPLVFCIFPQMLVIMIGPAAINIWEHLIRGGP